MSTRYSDCRLLQRLTIDCSKAATTKFLIDGKARDSQKSGTMGTAEDKELVGKLPAFFRTLSGQKPSKEDLETLLEIIRKSHQP